MKLLKLFQNLKKMQNFNLTEKKKKLKKKKKKNLDLID